MLSRPNWPRRKYGGSLIRLTAAKNIVAVPAKTRGFRFCGITET